MMTDQPSSTTRADEGQWSGVEDTIEDPEETKVIFAALDSFASVIILLPHPCTVFFLLPPSLLLLCLSYTCTHM
jgi:hypothetical protein